MIDPIEEDPVSLREATHLPFLKRNGCKPHLATLYRWTKDGLRGVVLESIQIGGTRSTTREALLRFFNRLSSRHASTVVRTPRQRQRAIERAEKELQHSGI